jgi:hypothetical protein
MKTYIITTVERVEGTYEVRADSEIEARAKFIPQPGRLIDWSGVEQVDYMAFAVEVRDYDRGTPVGPKDPEAGQE